MVAQVNDDRPRTYEELREITYSGRLTSQKRRATGGTDPLPIVTSKAIRERADAFLNNATVPTFTGLALALAFDSVAEWEQAMADTAARIAAEKADKEDLARLQAWNRARSRIQVWYEEGMQTGLIPPTVGKFVLEVLGFVAKRPEDVQAPTAKVAADAARAGYAQAYRDMDKLDQAVAEAIRADVPELS
jgi:hypothetical protein